MSTHESDNNEFLEVPELPDTDLEKGVYSSPNTTGFIGMISNSTKNKALVILLAAMAGTSYFAVRKGAEDSQASISQVEYENLVPEGGSGRRPIDLMEKKVDDSGRRSIDQNISKNASDAVLKYSQIAHLSEQKIFEAYNHFANALSDIKSDASLYSKLNKLGISLRDPEFYLAIAIKESALDPEAGKGSYVGYLQLRKRPDTSNARDRSPLKDLEEKFGISGTNDDLLDPESNAKFGILYFHLCRDGYLKNVVPEADKDPATYFSYNVGQGDFKHLWNFFKPDSFDDFEKKVSILIARKFPKVFAYNPRLFFDKSYGISYYTYLELLDKEASQNKKIKINGRVFDAGKLFRAFRYVGAIESIVQIEPSTDADIASK